MTTVRDLEIANSILDWVNSVQDTKDFTDISEVSPEFMDSYWFNQGYTKIVTDSGKYAYYAQGKNLIYYENTGTAKSTGTLLSPVSTSSDVSSVETIDASGTKISSEAISNARVSNCGISNSPSGSSMGTEASTFLLTPKNVILTAVAGACGVALTFDLARDWLDDGFFSGDKFNWADDSVGGKVLTWLAHINQATDITYISKELVERIKNKLIEIGVFKPKIYTWTDVPQFSDEDIFIPCIQINKSIGELVDAIGMEHIYGTQAARERGEALVAHVIQDYLDYGGLGYWQLRQAAGGHTQLYIYQCEGELIGGNVCNSGAVITETHNNPAGGGTHQVPIADNLHLKTPNSMHLTIYDIDSNLVVTKTHSVTPTSVINNSSYVGYVWSSNIGEYSGEGLPVKPGGIVPTEGLTLDDDYPNWTANEKYVDDLSTNGAIQDKINSRRPIIPIKTPYADPTDTSQTDIQDGEVDDDDKDKIGGLIGDFTDDYPIIDPDPTPTPDPDPNVDPDPRPDPPDPPVDPPFPPVPPPIGPTPPVIVPPTSGTGSGFVHIYNPTLAQLASFSQWLWSDLLDLDTFKKLFQDPMQAIIGLSLVYATPNRTGSENIIVGNLDSGCVSRICTQYVTVNCGTFRINRYYNNVLDYTSTRIQLFLPFIGIVALDTSEVVGRTIGVRYGVDVMTGTCLATVTVDGRELYTFQGNAAIQLPISAANYSSVIGSLTGLIGGGLATIASGGAAAPLFLGAAGSAVSGIQHQVERSGSVGSNAGAMGRRKPYLIITRDVPYNPSGYNVVRGYPSNVYVKMSRLSGYTRVKEVRLSGITATQTEIDEIERLLKSGVIV